MGALDGVRGREKGRCERMCGDDGDDGDDAAAFPDSTCALSRLTASHLPPPPSTSTFSTIISSAAAADTACAIATKFGSMGECSRGGQGDSDIWEEEEGKGD
jgi:hypothetical protein